MEKAIQQAISKIMTSAKSRFAVTYENGTAVPVPELITDTKGYAVSPELPYGSYVVVESTTPENLKTIDPFVVNVENDSREPMQWRVFDDRPFEFLLKIVKKDAQTGNTVLKAGASYKIYDVTNKKYVEQVVQYPKKERSVYSKQTRRISDHTAGTEVLYLPNRRSESTGRICKTGKRGVPV